MTQTTAPPTPTTDPLREALDDPAVRDNLHRRALIKLGTWLHGAPARREEEADDITAETLKRAWAGQAKYDPAQSVLGWLYGILNNVLHEYRRRLERQPQSLAIDLPGREVAARFENQELLARVLDRLTPDERNLVELSLGDDEVSYPQIAERFQITVGNARVRLSRVLQKLRRQLQKEGER